MKNRSSLVLAVLFLLGVGAWVGSAAWRTSAGSGHRAEAAAAALVLLFAIGLVVHIGLVQYQVRTLKQSVDKGAGADEDAVDANIQFRRRGLKAAIVGADGRVSTSKTQVFLWTAFLVAGFVYLLILVRSYSGGTLFTNAITTNWRPEYLVLIGLPVAAATIASGAVKGSNNGLGPVSTADAKTVAAAPKADPTSVTADTSLNDNAVKVLSSSTKVYSRDPVGGDVNGILPGLAELITDETGALAWPDLQYVVFTLITLATFCAQILANPTNGLPPVPAALLTLMGVSSTGYVANKVVQVQGKVPTADPDPAPAAAPEQAAPAPAPEQAAPAPAPEQAAPAPAAEQAAPAPAAEQADQVADPNKAR
jgi:hypothetical protein